MPMLLTGQGTLGVTLPIAQLARSYRFSAVRRPAELRRPSDASVSSAPQRATAAGLTAPPLARASRIRMAEASTAAAADVVVQYVVLRRDLWTEHGWPLGSIIAQGCHASTAAMWQNKDDDVVRSYFSPENLDSMHKVVLEIKGETQLRNLSSKLEEAGILHKLWIEQPEDFPTCLATKPYHKSEVAQYFKKLQLCKGNK